MFGLHIFNPNMTPVLSGLKGEKLHGEILEVHVLKKKIQNSDKRCSD